LIYALKKILKIIQILISRMTDEVNARALTTNL